MSWYPDMINYFQFIFLVFSQFHHFECLPMKKVFNATAEFSSSFNFVGKYLRFNRVWRQEHVRKYLEFRIIWTEFFWNYFLTSVSWSSFSIVCISLRIFLHLKKKTEISSAENFVVCETIAEYFVLSFNRSFDEKIELIINLACLHSIRIVFQSWQTGPFIVRSLRKIWEKFSWQSKAKKFDFKMSSLFRS